MLAILVTVLAIFLVVLLVVSFWPLACAIDTTLGDAICEATLRNAELSESICTVQRSIGWWLLDRQSLLSSAALRLQPAAVYALVMALRRAESWPYEKSRILLASQFQ
jgi:hypothetical protein